MSQKAPAAPRGFDKEAALLAAMRQFQSRGFEGVSIEDLTAAMGISRPTLYAVYGGKEELFRQALGKYASEEGSFYIDAAEAPTAKGVAERLLYGPLENFPNGESPAGCLFVSHLVARGEGMDIIRADIVARARAGEKALYARFKRAKQEGDLPRIIDEVGLTHYLLALGQGISIQAGSGADKTALQRLIEVALTLWPSRLN